MNGQMAPGIVRRSTTKKERMKRMSRKRAEIEELPEKVKNGQKKYIRYAEGAELYSMGQHSFRELAKEADAVRKVKGVALVNVRILDDYIETMYGNGMDSMPY